MTLPFKMHVETDMEAYRAKTFWTKEPETIEWVKSFSDGDVFFDIGANIGVYSLYAASIFPNSKIGAFEPDRNNCNRLTQNVILNGFNGRLIPVNLMLSDKYGKASFVPVSNEIGASGGQCVEDESGTDYTQTVDEFVDYSFDFPSPDHVKIDVDGNELKILRGMEKTLQHVKSLLVEVSSETSIVASEIIHCYSYNKHNNTCLSFHNHFNQIKPHSSDRREKEGIDAQNLIFTRTI